MKISGQTNAPKPAASSMVSTNELRDIKPPVRIPTGWELLWWVLGALALAAAIYGLVRYLKQRRRPVPPPPVPPHIRARRKLMDALRLLPEPKEFCIVVSDTIRIYLEERFDFRAPERTTEEFLRELSNTELLNATQKLSLADFLQSCDLVKFAKYEPTETELRELHASALRLVDETQPLETPAVGPAQPATSAPASESVSTS